MLVDLLLRVLMYEVLEEGFFTVGRVKFGRIPPRKAIVAPRLPVRLAAPLNVFDLGDQGVLGCSMVLIAALSLWLCLFLPPLPGGVITPFTVVC